MQLSLLIQRERTRGVEVASEYLVYASLHNTLKKFDFSKCDVLSEVMSCVYRVTCPNSYIGVTLMSVCYIERSLKYSVCMQNQVRKQTMQCGVSKQNSASTSTSSRLERFNMYFFLIRVAFDE